MTQSIHSRGPEHTRPTLCHRAVTTRGTVGAVTSVKVYQTFVCVACPSSRVSCPGVEICGVCVVRPDFPLVWTRVFASPQTTIEQVSPSIPDADAPRSVCTTKSCPGARGCGRPQSIMSTEGAEGATGANVLRAHRSAPALHRDWWRPAGPLPPSPRLSSPEKLRAMTRPSASSNECAATQQVDAFELACRASRASRDEAHRVSGQPKRRPLRFALPADGHLLRLSHLARR
jgi:hypothetical protein